MTKWVLFTRGGVEQWPNETSWKSVNPFEIPWNTYRSLKRLELETSIRHTERALDWTSVNSHMCKHRSQTLCPITWACKFAMSSCRPNLTRPNQNSQAMWRLSSFSMFQHVSATNMIFYNLLVVWSTFVEGMTHNDDWCRSHEHASYMYISCAMYCTSILSIVYTTLGNCNKICTTSPCGARPARIHWQAWGTESIFHGKHLDATSNRNSADFYKVKIPP